MIRAPADVQLTADQLLLESRQWSESRTDVRKQPRPRIDLVDAEEVEQVLRREREQHEVKINTRKKDLSVWLRYCHFEEANRNFPNARGIYERALVANYEAVPIWMSYIDMELRQGFLNHARNVLDRAVYLLPKVHQLWYRYVYLEELAGDYLRAREVFCKWMAWKPHPEAWLSYARFEKRCRETALARAVFKRFVLCHNLLSSWLKWARFEESLAAQHPDGHNVRDVFEQALLILPLAPDADADTRDADAVALDRQQLLAQLYAAYAAFEARMGHAGRARELYRRALDHLQAEHGVALRKDVYDRYIAFEKQHGDRQSLSELIYVRSRFRFEQQLAQRPLQWDLWFDYARLEERSLAEMQARAGQARQAGDRARYLQLQEFVPDALGRVRQIYQRATALAPENAVQKRLWARYVWLYVAFAVFEETAAKDPQAARDVYQRAIRAVPHAQFTFGKLWVLAAQFEIRQRNLQAARKILGNALGHRPSLAVYRAYVGIERRIGDFERCRRICEGMLQRLPHLSGAWRLFIQLEVDLEEPQRARTLFELALEHPGQLDSPEEIWKDYLAFELRASNHPGVRSIYERLLAQLPSVRIWLNYAHFELFAGEVDRARTIFRRCWELMQKVTATSDRAQLLEAWIAMEKQHGTEQSLDIVNQLSSTQQQQQQQQTVLTTSTTSSTTPSISVTAQLSLAERARRWREQQQQQQLKSE